VVDIRWLPLLLQIWWSTFFRNINQFLPNCCRVLQPSALRNSVSLNFINFRPHLEVPILSKPTQKLIWREKNFKFAFDVCVFSFRE